MLDLTRSIGLKTQAQQLAQLHQQQQQRQQHLQQLHVGQQLRQHQQQQQHAVQQQQQQHQLNIKQEVVENATGQTTQQTIDQSNSNNISQNIANGGGNGGVVGQHHNVNKGGNGGHFVDSTTTPNSITSHAGFLTHNNTTALSRAGSCDNVNGPGASSNPNRDLFSLQEELLNGTSLISSDSFFCFYFTPLSNILYWRRVNIYNKPYKVYQFFLFLYPTPSFLPDFL